MAGAQDKSDNRDVINAIHEVKNELKNLRTHLESRIDGLEGKIVEVRRYLESRIDGLEDKIVKVRSELKNRIDELEDEYEGIRRGARTAQKLRGVRTPALTFAERSTFTDVYKVVPYRDTLDL